MLYRENKKGDKLSILGFGCMRFPRSGGKIDEEKTEKLILSAYESGVNYYDTAYLYGGSEEVLGRILNKHGLREKVKVATKLPHSGCHTPEDIERLFQISLSRLGTDYVDNYLMHNVSSFAQWESLVAAGVEGWISEKKAEGSIRNIGFSYHGSLVDFKKLVDAYDWDFCQIQYNYANETYQAGKDGLRYASSKGLPVIIMEPLLGGQLAAKLPDKAKAEFQKRSGGDPVQASVSWALRWLWDQPEVTVVLSGMNESEQLEANLKSADLGLANSFTDEDREMFSRVLSIFRQSYRIPCTGCSYCMPCVKGINIPAVFAAYNSSYSQSLFTGLFGYAMSVGAHGNFPHYASDCISCGKCMKHCPQKIKIPEEMKRVRRRLQVPGMKTIMKIYTKREQK